MSGDLEPFRQTAISAALRGAQIFAGLPSEDVRQIARITAIRSLDKGGYLFQIGRAHV